uniref:Ig-like domain-containing protein n=1 Tax=Latimeria chalumnae TaxID=7897 RepID=H3A2I9_LATCH
ALCQPWSASIPQSLHAVKGSCVVIPCTFNYPGPKRPSRDIRAIWYSNGGETFYDSDRSSNGRADLVGDRGEKNCSLQVNGIRTEDAKEFSFRVEIMNLDSYSFTNSKVRIEVEVSPGLPRIQPPCPKEITENVTVAVTCTTSHTCPTAPPGLTWKGPQGSSTVQHRPLQDGLWEVSSTLTFTPSYTDHGKSLTCEVIYPEGKYTENSIKLRVRYPPKPVTAVLSEEGEIVEGGKITLTCASDGNPAVTYTWIKEKQVRVTKGSQATLVLKMVTSQDDGDYYCRARNKLGDKISRKIHINVVCKYNAPRNTKVTLSNSTVPEGGALTLTCETESNPPAQITWYKDGIQYSRSSERTLQFAIVTRQDSGNYSCVATNTLG